MASNPYRFQSVDPRNNPHVLSSDQQKGEKEDNGFDKLHRAVTNLKQLIDVFAKRTDEEGGVGESSAEVDLERGHVRPII
ncbi:hypothetical protein TgHK011_007915 [Trichoderma gracile]|nr:hypothetical protein TgHK011_007915 [Trichoderma gracile]